MTSVCVCVCVCVYVCVYSSVCVCVCVRQGKFIYTAAFKAEGMRRAFQVREPVCYVLCRLCTCVDANFPSLRHSKHLCVCVPWAGRTDGRTDTDHTRAFPVRTPSCPRYTHTQVFRMAQAVCTVGRTAF